MKHHTCHQVSVIIPVWNDPAGLAICLKALAGQDWPSERMEVLVVDNGSDRLPDEVVGAYPWARLLEESEAGSYAARNRALVEAEGGVVAFTDADCVPEPGWLSAGVARLEAEGPDAVIGGAIRMFCRDADRPTSVELLELAVGLPQQQYVEASGFAATANLVTWRSVMDRVGGFDASIKSGGDREWGARAAAAGCRLVYAEDVGGGAPGEADMAGAHRAQPTDRGGDVRDAGGGVASAFAGCAAAGGAGLA
ncbi:MAG: glycosyltransferase family A protein [Planctomycetota bacterium]